MTWQHLQQLAWDEKSFIQEDRHNQHDTTEVLIATDTTRMTVKTVKTGSFATTVKV